MRLPGAHQRRLVIQGPRGEFALVLRIAWKYGAYGGGGPFPGVRRAARSMFANAVLRLVPALAVAVWVLLVPLPAPVRVPVPADDAPRLRVPDLASGRMTTGP